MFASFIFYFFVCEVKGDRVESDYLYSRSYGSCTNFTIFCRTQKIANSAKAMVFRHTHEKKDQTVL